MPFPPAPATDFKGAPLSTIDPVRDLPNILGHWDAATLTGAAGDGVDALADVSGWAQDLTAYTSGTKPMTIAMRNGKRVIRTNSASNYLNCTGWGNRWGGTPAVTGPITVIAVVAVSSAFDGTTGFPRTIWSGAQWDLNGTLSAATSAGAATVTSNINPPVGEYIRLDSGGNREVVQVVGISGSSAPYTLTLAAPLALAHASGVGLTTAPTKLQYEGTGQGPTVGSPLPASGTPPTTPGLNDDQLHVHATMFEASQIRHLVDGLVTSSTAPDTPALGALVNLYFGGMGARGMQGDLAQLIICRGVLTPAQINAATQSLCTKWGIPFAGRSDLAAWRSAAAYIGGASSDGQSTRIFPAPPSTRKPTGNPLVIWSHPHAANEQVSINYFSGPTLAALNNMGCTVAASNLVGNNWGNQAGLDSQIALYNRVVSYMGAPSAVVMVGGSMGGLASLLAVPDGRIPNIKGAYLIDGVCNLGTMFGPGSNTYSSPIRTAYGITQGTLSAATAAGVTSLPTTASFPTVGTVLLVGTGSSLETVTTTAASTGSAVAVTATTFAHGSGDPVSDYPTKTVGHDPSQFPASAFAGKRFRFWVADADTDVPRATNGDAFAARITGATERGVVAHPFGHLSSFSVSPADAVAFVKRCLS